MCYAMKFSFMFIFMFFCTLSSFVDAKKESSKPGELKIQVLYKPEECYMQAENGDQVFVHYTGKLENGQVFDTSREKDQPLPFVLGEGRVIKGWESGLKGMCIGEKRMLTIPPHLAYGDHGHPPVIPPNAVLTFETELVHIADRPGPDVLDLLYKVVSFLSVPVAVVLVIYYMYNRYKQAPTKKDLKQEMKRSKKKRN